MKPKHILITAAVVVVIVCGFFLVRAKFRSGSDQSEIKAFLSQFNVQLKAGDAKAALAFFDEDPLKPATLKLVRTLCGSSALNGNSKPLFKVELVTDDAVTSVKDAGQAIVLVPVRFIHNKYKAAQTTLTITVRKKANKQFKIAEVNTDAFQAEYLSYQNTIFIQTTPETAIFQPITLAAFKTAEQLKTRYDSVLWFQHIDGKTWFYVAKGIIPENFYWRDQDKPTDATWKMGLVDPALKEVVPAEYDLVHNIGGTIKGLVEVEKGNKKGFYDTKGKLVVPVDYEQILPLTDSTNKALLTRGNDHFYLKADMTISENIENFNIADVLPQVQHYAGSFKVDEKSASNIMEYNSRTSFSSLVVAPSYMVEWQILPKFMNFPNTLRKSPNEDDEELDASRYIDVKYIGAENKKENWFQSIFYSVVEDYLGGRGGLYENKKLLVVDKKQNRIIAFNADTYFGGGEGGGKLTGKCNDQGFRMLPDSVFEFKMTAELSQNMLDKHLFIQEGPYYYYLKIVKGKFVPMDTKRVFPTQFAKLDDSYLQSCFLITKISDDHQEPTSKVITNTTPEILQIMKNEIYASYRYKFKSARWNEVFEYRFNDIDTVMNANVDDSLTAIDKYNINWINNKLKITKPAVLALK